MARKPVKKTAEVFAAEIIKTPVAEQIEDNMKEYGVLTIEDRSIPDYRDGCKPVHRRLLWAFYNMGMRSTGSFSKSARMVGDTMGKYHPHGDQSIYDALVGMVNGAFPLIHGEGNFGWWNEKKVAAMRYTEAKLLKQAEVLLLNPYYLNVTDKIPNYDHKDIEPVVLPAMLPMALVVGCKTGIAVGATSKMPSFTFESVRELVHKAALKAVKTKTVPVVSDKVCFNTLELSTEFGGHVLTEDDQIEAMMKEGGGRIEWCCDYEYDAKERAFIVTGIAPDWPVESGMDRLQNLPGVMGATDESSGEVIRIMVKLAKSTSPKDVEPSLIKALTVAQSFVFNVTERIKVEDEVIDTSRSEFSNVTVADIVNRWFKWRIGLEKKALQAEMNESKVELARQELFLKAINHLDVIFALLKRKGIDKVAELSKKLKISVEDSRFIWSIAVGRLDKLNLDEVTAKIKVIKARQAKIRELYKNPAVVIEEQMKSLKTLAV